MSTSELPDGLDPVRAFQALGPDDILGPLESLGFVPDGRFYPLSSYENRVYRVGIEDGAPVVAKFYRPARWSDEAILEEHAFTLELAEREIPVVPPLVREGRTLHHSGPFRFAVFPSRGGRAPELDQPGVRRRLGRLVARLHVEGERRPFRHRPAIDIESYGYASRRYLLEEGFIPAELAATYEGVTAHLLENVAACFARAGAVRTLRPCSPAATSSSQPSSTTSAAARPCRTSGRGSPAAARSRCRSSPRCSRVPRSSAASTRASCTWSRRSGRCASCTTPPGSRAAG